MRQKLQYELTGAVYDMMTCGKVALPFWVHKKSREMGFQTKNLSKYEFKKFSHSDGYARN